MSKSQLRKQVRNKSIVYGICYLIIAIGTTLGTMGVLSSIVTGVGLTLDGLPVPVFIQILPGVSSLLILFTSVLYKETIEHGKQLRQDSALLDLREGTTTQPRRASHG